MRALAIAAASAAFAASPAAAQRAPRADSVLVVGFTGRLTGNLAAAAGHLSRTMVEVVAASGERVLHAPLEDVLALAGCAEPSERCLEQALDTFAVSRLVLGDIRPAAAGKVRVRLRLIARSRPARSESFVVAGDGAAALAARFRRRAVSFWRATEVPDDRPHDRPAPPPSPATPGSTAPADPLAVTSAPGAGFSAQRVHPVGWVMTGGGATLILAGGILLLNASDRQVLVDRAPIGTVEDFEALVELEESGRSYARWGTALLVIGAVASATGAAVIFKQGNEPSDAPDTDRPGLSLIPFAVPGVGIGASLTLRGGP
jgi:hypothetical protein